MMNQTESESTQSRVNKEPWLAVNLSKLLPGMGQIYAGRPLKGYIIAFIYLSSLPLGILLAIHQHSFPFGIALLIVGILIVPIWNLFDAYHVAKQQNSLEFEAERRQSPDAWLAVFLSSFIPGAGHAHILHQYIETSINSDRSVRKRAQNNINENSEHHSPLCPSFTLHTDGIDA